MAKVKSPLLSFAASGSIMNGGLTFATTRKTTSARIFKRKATSNTAAQAVQRANFSNATKWFAGLHPYDRGLWEHFNPPPQWSGNNDIYSPTAGGKGLFMKEALARLKQSLRPPKIPYSIKISDTVRYREEIGIMHLCTVFSDIKKGV